MVIIRRTLEEDLVTISEIRIRAFEWDVEVYGRGPEGYDSLEQLKESFQRAIYYTILFENIIIGAIVIKEKNAVEYRLGGIYIDPEYHNKGIGSEAIQFLETEYKQVKKWTLDTPYKSYRNHHFYEKMGYVKIKEVHPFNNEFTLFEYEKIIQ